MNAKRGFTLVELLVVLAVSAIILAAGVPALRSFVLNNQRAATVNDLVASLNLARSEALKRAQTVTVCRVADPNASPPVCDTGSGWSDGWIVFADANANNKYDPGNSDDPPLIRQYPATPANTTLASNISTGRIEFDRLGASQGSAGRITYCDSRGAAQGRTIVLSSQGRVRTEDAASCNP